VVRGPTPEELLGLIAAIVKKYCPDGTAHLTAQEIEADDPSGVVTLEADDNGGLIAAVLR
jgi:hypothetical protein